jgi:low affinity Fe/Cu permease
VSDDGHAAESLSRQPGPFARGARRATTWAGSPWAIVGVMAGAVVWLAAGWASGFPRGWELVVTVGVPLVTLVLLILVQHTQNHDDGAIQLKLDEVIRVLEQASNSMIRVEEGSGDDLNRLRHHFREDVPPSREEDAGGPGEGRRPGPAPTAAG